MRVLLDTNVLTRLANPADESTRVLAETSVELIQSGGHILSLLPQNIYEFWSVATRPTEQNGFGWSPQDVRVEVDMILEIFPLLQDARAIFPRWLELVSDYQVRGKPTHDARLVAGMLRHGVEYLITFNDRDFSRYEQIKSLHPQDIVDGKVALPTQSSDS